MSNEPTNAAKGSGRVICIAIALLLGAIVATGLRIYGDHEVPADDPIFGHSKDPALSRELGLSPPDKREGRGVLVPRASKGEIPDPAAYSAWGFTIAENLVGSPQPGDIAYIARLGPERGSMRVESVEGNRAILSFDTLDRALIRGGDRVETMPPSSTRDGDIPAP